MFFGSQFFLGGEHKILDLVLKLDPIPDHVAKVRGDRPRDRRGLALNKKKKETAGKHKGRIALSQRAALFIGHW